MKIDGEPTQSDINNLKNELAESIVKIKTMEDIAEQGKKYGFHHCGIVEVKNHCKKSTVWNKHKTQGHMTT